ncbi:MAG: NADH-quinone oxidoreductase subunit, partial [Bacteroidota bacterium]|nr:NADH-quinone oxidoreductase subunit [Bacteroidota bacterium]
MGNEIILSLPIYLIGMVSVAALLFDAFSPKSSRPSLYFAIIGLSLTCAAAIYSLTIPNSVIDALNPQNTIAKGMIEYGGYSAFFDIIFCIGAIMTLLSSRRYNTREYGDYKEYYSLILFSVCGMMLISHSNNLLMLFIGVELMSIPFYILAGFFRTKISSVEAALKYFLLGAFATGFLLYGMAMLYGAAGSLNITVIAAKIKMELVTPIYLIIGFGLIIIGLAFKVAAFPFHQWAPDVYHGSPTVVSGFMSAAGKAAALAAFIIITRAIMPFDIKDPVILSNSNTARLIIALIAASTMLIGNITALVQKNVKRMLAYSSVAHAGYLLMGIVAANNRGWSGIIFYASAYTLMQIGAFVVISLFERNDGENLEIKDYAGLSKRHPMIAASMAIFMLSLAGIPPMAGFFGKYYLFAAAVEA